MEKLSRGKPPGKQLDEISSLGSGTGILSYFCAVAEAEHKLLSPFTLLCRLWMPSIALGYECVALLATVQDRE